MLHLLVDSTLELYSAFYLFFLIKVLRISLIINNFARIIYLCVQLLHIGNSLKSLYYFLVCASYYILVQFFYIYHCGSL